MVYRGRFAPSPTGPLHFGSLIAAVGSYLEARSQDGVWLVRMEDLDPPRVMPGAGTHILHTLHAFGFDWDEPVVQQSMRSDAYHAALHRLRAEGLVYPCGCSRREITDSAVRGIEGPVYPGTCRAGLRGARAARALRVRTLHDPIGFTDTLQGETVQSIAREIGDFVLYRADHVFAYQLAVVVDDAEQGITDVVRGSDLLLSTPRQIHLQRQLDLPTPRYLHLPVAVNGEGQKLSKQTLATAVEEDEAVPALASVLEFLGQTAAPSMRRLSLRNFWVAALEQWDPARIPRVRERPAPDGL
jgi:glutamyl-Q tRNA(Asp) synthetase